MPINYSCFISYPSGQGELLQKFIAQLQKLLEERLELYVDRPLYYDKKRLGPGYRFNEALGSALCQSACLIVIYMPKYEKRSYCLREFKAMEELEERRLQALGDRLKNHNGMIIPLVLRCSLDDSGKPKLPEWIRKRWNYVDFSKYASEQATDNIAEHTQYIREIEKIAQTIHEIYSALASLNEDPGQHCSDFAIPGEESVMDRLQAVAWEDRPSLPLRESGK